MVTSMAMMSARFEQRANAWSLRRAQGRALAPSRSIRFAVAAPLLLTFSALGFAFSAHGQMSGFTARPLLQSSVEHDERKEAAVLAITLAPGGSSGRHTHPGDCYGTLGSRGPSSCASRAASRAAFPPGSPGTTRAVRFTSSETSAIRPPAR